MIKLKGDRVVKIAVVAIFALALLVTGCLFTFDRTPASATTETTLSVSGNLYDTNGNLDLDMVTEFLSVLQYSADDSLILTSPQIAGRVGLASDGSRSFTFQMGYYADKSGNLNTSIPITWQATYLRNGYLTVWMANNYTIDVFNNSNNTNNISGWGNGTNYYSINGNRIAGNYSYSTAHDITKNIYSAMSTNLDNFSDIIKSPQEAGATWQQTQANGNGGYYINNTTWARIAILNGMESNSGTDFGLTNYTECNPHNFPWSSVYNDKFWLPSVYEIFSTSYSSTSSTNGLWQVNSSSVRQAASSSPYQPDCSNTSQNSWLRSGYCETDVSSRYNYGYYVTTSLNFTAVTTSYGIRPACHIDLSYLNTISNYDVAQVTASVDTGSTEFLQLDKTSDAYIGYYNRDAIFTFTPNDGYYVSEIYINNQKVDISEDIYAYKTDVTGLRYKCYHLADRVVVAINQPTVPTHIVGHAAVDRVTVVTYDPTITLMTDSMYSWASDTEYYTYIIAKAEYSSDLCLFIDGTPVALVSDGFSDTVEIDGRPVRYQHTISNGYLIIVVRNLSIATHTISLEYNADAGANINARFADDTGTISVIRDEDYKRIVVTPDNGRFVTSVNIGGVLVNIDYYEAKVYGASYATQIMYYASDATSTFILEIKDLSKSIEIVFNTSSIQNSLEVPPTTSGGSFGVTGTMATATTGGEVRMVGNDIANGTDDDTVTLMAVAYSGYDFVGWVYTDNDDEIISTSTNLVLSKVDANGKALKAVFVLENANSSTNGTLNGSHDFV